MRTLNLSDYLRGQAMYVVGRSSRKEISLHGHDFHELMHITSGTGMHLLNGARSPMSPGQTWYVGPEDFHGIVPGRNGMDWINVAFHHEPWLAFTSLTRFRPPSLLQDRSRVPFDCAVEASRNGTTGWDLTRLLLDALKPSPDPHNSDWLSDAIAKFDQPDNISGGVPSLRSLASVSPSYLTRMVKARYGMTPTELVTKRRLARAAHLLSTSSLTIENVASQSGIENLSYFYRLFHREYGVTPREYRLRATLP